MADRLPVPLTPALIGLGSPEFRAISGWPFADPFVARLLKDDIPQRVRFGECRVWVYRDPDGRLVGFGTLDVSDDCRDFTAGRPHPYIPLLAVNPTIKSLGYGANVLRHLTDEAALLATDPDRAFDFLFLDVYTTSDRAIKLYAANGFVPASDEPFLDTQDEDKPYVVMMKRVGFATA
jgi:GNAT superfamily N-acetyltransferase